MEEIKLPIITQFLNLNEAAAETLNLKKPLEQKLIKKYSTELNNLQEKETKTKNFEEISKNLIAMGIKPRMALNGFLVFKYSNIEEALELLCKSPEGEYNHRFIASDESLCFVCCEDEEKHRSISKILSGKSFRRNSVLEEDENLRRKVTEKEINLRKSLSFGFGNDNNNNRISSVSSNKKLFELKNLNNFKSNSNNKLDDNKYNNYNSDEKLFFDSDDFNKIDNVNVDNYNNNKKRNNFIECPICFLEIEEKNKIFYLDCKHVFCTDCIKEYLNEEIKNSRVLSITCPQKNCNSLFEEKIVKELVCEEVFYKYKKFLLREKYSTMQNAICCPITNCEGYANKTEDLIDKGSNTAIENNIKAESILEVKPNVNHLPEPSSKQTKNAANLNKNANTNKKQKLFCNFNHEICSLCLSAWHGAEGCDEDREIKAFILSSGIIPKKCPKCKVWTEKNLGCNHMTCRICQFNWCWLCLCECLPDHYFVEGTACFGKQFNERSNPNEVFLMRLLMNHSIYFISTFFIAFVTVFMIHMIFQNRNLVNAENLNNFNNNNNRNNNRGDIENNLNRGLLENEANRNHNTIMNNNRNREDNANFEFNGNENYVVENLTFGQKLGLFAVGECIISIFFLILAITNGFFLIPLLTLLGQILIIENKHVRMLCFLTFCTLFTIFYITGIVLSCVWLIFTSSFLAYKIIKF